MRRIILCILAATVFVVIFYEVFKNGGEEIEFLIEYFLKTGRRMAAPTFSEIHQIASRHLRELHEFYGEYQGLRIARKHIGWYLAGLPGGADIRAAMNTIEDAHAQASALDVFFARLIDEDAAALKRAA